MRAYCFPMNLMRTLVLGTTGCLLGISSFLLAPASVTASASTGPTMTRSAGAATPPKPAVLPAVPPTDSTVFASAGPFVAGVTTLKVPALSSKGSGVSPTRPGTTAEVWYPVYPLNSHQIVAKTDYDLKALLPAAQRKALGARSGTLQTTAAARGEPIAPGGPFPVVVFSHGFGGFPTQSAFLMTHLASWGFVVVAPDHPSRDLAAVLSGKARVTSPTTATATVTVDADADADADDLRAVVVALGRSSLRRSVDLNNLAAVGHSAGANAIVRWSAGEPRVQGLVLLAGGVSGLSGQLPEPLRPVLFMSAANDRLVSAQSIASAYRSSQSPKRLIVLKDSGHLAFTEICTLGSGPGGLIGDAERLGVVVPAAMKLLGTDGCGPPNAAVTKAWPIVRSSVVAELRAIFGTGTPGFGLDSGTLDSLAGQGAVGSTFTIG